MNLSRLSMSEENEIFLMKCVLAYLQKILPEKTQKNKKNTAERRKKKVESEVILVKKLKIKHILKEIIL